jgi:alpha-tubulin suppressor-like RCC1 family protein
MPTFYNFRQNGVDYSFDDVFVPADLFRSGNLWTWGIGFNGRLGTNDTTPDRSTPVTTFAGGTDWKQVSAGREYTAAIKTDGTLWIWGSGGLGQLGTNDTTQRNTPVTTFAGGTNWKQVSSGNFHTAAIKTDGTLWTWGRNLYGSIGRISFINTPVTTFAGGNNWKSVPLSSPENFYSISTGERFAAAIKTDGTLWVWGKCDYGVLGNGVTEGFVSTPITTFAGGTNWRQVSCGRNHISAIKTDGTLWGWGVNNSRQLASNDTINRSTPITTFAGGTNWRQVSSGFENGAGIKTDGTLWVWGINGGARLGTVDNFIKLTPVTTFAGGTNWRQVSVSNSFLATKTDGTLWVWGVNGSYGKLGTNSIDTPSTPVTTFAGGTNWRQVESSTFATCATKTDGTLWVWGSALNSRMGTGDTSPARLTPITTFVGGSDWSFVTMGLFNVMAIKNNGTLWSWGRNERGQSLTDSIFTNSTPTTTFVGGVDWINISTSSHIGPISTDSGSDLFSVAIRGDGTNNQLFTFGSISTGQLGNSMQGENDTIPAKVFGDTSNWKQVSSGYRHTAAIKTDGTLWTWGIGTNGQLGTNDLTDRSTPVTTFAGGTNWKQVSSGGSHTAAIKTDGTLWTWGYGGNGRLGTNDLTTRSTPVTTFAGGTDWKQGSSGSFHTAAIKTDGTLWTWGTGSSGQLGTNNTGQRNTPVTTFAGGTDWKQVSSASFHTAAIKTDGTLWTWGIGTSGRLGNANTTNRSTPVTTFAGGTNWKQVSSFNAHTAAVTYEDPIL